MQDRTRDTMDFGGTNLTRSIVQDLGRAIVVGDYRHDLPFPSEAELCTKYSASRTVLREAVKMLTAKGLLKSLPRRGTWAQPEAKWNLLDPEVLSWLLARKFSIELLVDFTNVRLAIEPQAAALAAITATTPQRAEIITAIQRMEAAEREEDDALESDIAFHIAVLNASNNRFIAQFNELTEATLRFSIRRTNAYKGVPRASAADHRKVADAILSGHREQAALEMTRLIQGALDLLLEAGGHSG